MRDMHFFSADGATAKVTEHQHVLFLSLYAGYVHDHIPENVMDSFKWN